MSGLSKAAAVVGYDAIAGFEQGERLVLEHVAGQRPAVDQQHSPSLAIVFHVKLDAVLRFDECHFDSHAHKLKSIGKPASAMIVPSRASGGHGGKIGIRLDSAA